MPATSGNPAELNGPTYKILLVDDNAQDHDVYPDAFSDTGKNVEVKKFIHGEALFTYLQQLDASAYPNVIVLDQVSGPPPAIDILKQLKNDPRYVRIPVIIHSSILSKQLKEELLKDGAEEFTESKSVMEAVKKFVHQLRN